MVVQAQQHVGTFWRHERSDHVRIVVDLTRCQSYGQCVFLAPNVFRFHGEEALEYDYTPDDQQREQVRWAAAACPVQAITLDYQDVPPETGTQPERGGGQP
jgi:ferredoxin